MSDMSILKPFRFGSQVDIEDKVDRLERIIVTWHLVDGWFHQKSGDGTAPPYDMFYLHFTIEMKQNVGKYTIHGSYG